VELYPRLPPPGSVFIAGVEGVYGVAPLGLVLVLANIGEGVCEVWGAFGDLSDDINIKIGLVALGHMFKRMDFQAVKGSRVTRYATWIRSDELFDYYTVDLIATAERLGIQA
jgi:hypothetical protein